MIWLWIWGIVTALALIIEFLTSDLITIWFSAGGLVTLFVVALAPELHIVWQLVIFVGVSVVLLLCTRKICLKLLNKSETKTNTEAYIGIKFVVEELQENFTYHKINGVAWRVYATEGESLVIGSEYEICAIQGNKLIAKKV
ncbi:MAG: NfeD family protein, partial [Clostridia bacterium]|nr:NfeD family protein [Clostridia bacterium]